MRSRCGAYGVSLAYVHCSPIWLVPKGRDTGKWQMIVDLSYQPLQSVKNSINASLKYASMDDTLQGLARGTLLLKVDLHEECLQHGPSCDMHLMEIMWRGGGNSLSIWYCRLACALPLPCLLRLQMALFLGIPLLIHYLDNFLFFGASIQPKSRLVATHGPRHTVQIGCP